LNAHNLFDSFDDPYRLDETTPPKSPASRKALAELIQRLNADILALQEIESRDVLAEFLRRELPQDYPFIACLEGNDVRGIDVALISRLPIISASSYQWQGWQPIPGVAASGGFARDVLHVRVQATTTTMLDILVLHLKSQEGGETSALWRAQEATHVRRIVDDLLSDTPNTALIVAGDFNAPPDSPSLAPLLRPASGTLLTDIARFVPESERFSYVFGEKREQIDYILLSPRALQWLDRDTVRFLHHELKEATDHDPLTAVLHIPGQPVSWFPPPPLPDYEELRRKESLPIVSVADIAALEKCIGKWTRVKGRISRVITAPSGNVRFLNFAEGTPDTALSGVIFPDNFSRFPHLKQLIGKEVILEGIVTRYDSRFQIVLHDPSQIQLVSGN